MGGKTSWEADDLIAISKDDGIFAFHITVLTTGVTIAKTEDAATLQDNGDGSYTLSGGAIIGAHIGVEGLCDIAADGKTYTLKSDLSISYSLDNAQMGDFYCKSSDGSTGYLMPKDTPLTDVQKTACLGIVMKVGSSVSKVNQAIILSFRRLS